jgi:anhydro-N-acetylmuramic acid kinase
MALYIGLMSGTSLDGIDGVLADFGKADDAPPRLLGHAHRPFSTELRTELLALNHPGDNELHRAALAANALARECAALVAELGTAGVRAVGAHGQTVRHRPGEFDDCGYTLQLLNGALLAELCGVDVVCDFRTRDVAAGGQGAPLVPAFHAALFAEPGRAVAVLNLGGIANLTLLGAQGELRGFDCGPANALLDGWCQRHQGQPYDDDGRWAATGRVDAALLAALLAQPYFRRPPPKSTGRDLFHLGWLGAQLGAQMRPIAAADVQATLAEFTAQAVAGDLGRHAPHTQRLLVCGGGARNGFLMRRLAALLPALALQTTAARGLDVMQVEAAAFAWLAQRFVARAPGNCVAVTGAAGPRVLGALYPAG